METKDDSGSLVQARRAYSQRAWRTAFELFSKADSEQPLPAHELDQLARCAALVGQDATFLALLERCYQMHVDSGATLEAARSAFWIGFRSLGLGDFGKGSAWLGRCQAIVQAAEGEHVLAGYLLVPTAFQQISLGKMNEAAEIATRAIELGERFSDADLTALAQNQKGRALLCLGKRDEGLTLLDQSMLPVLSDQVSPIMAGLIYCGVIASCQRYCELDRAREWTLALTSWCEAQPELVTFRGNCQVHRAEVLELSGDWRKALNQASLACAQAEKVGERAVVADAHYQQAEIHRLQGKFDLAEAAYEQAGQLGRDLQPGFALLRCAQGRTDSARQGLIRALAETQQPFQRAKLLAAAVDVDLAARDIDSASQAARELDALAQRFDNEVLTALSARARGCTCLAKGDPQGALGPLRSAFFTWQRIGAPFQEARLQAELAIACEALGDGDGAELARAAAKRVFEQLGAFIDPVIADEPVTGESPRAGGLTARELQVLHLVAVGKTNKEVAVELDLSERTVDRHVSNIFRKLNVTTRAGATAAAYKQGWVRG